MVKKISLVLFFVIVGAGVYISYGKFHPAPISDGLNHESVSQTINSSTNAKETRFVPSKLIIPNISVNTAIESVGLDSEKRMDVPKNDLDVGWYQKGPVPGEKGSAVIDGHFDTKNGGPAVFYRLSELKSGDSIIVTSKDGEERTFVVTDTKVFKDESFPIPLVFSQDDTERLNLITCDGVFDKNEKNYSDRLVVFSELKKN